MLHPIYSTVISRPDLLVDHLSAYAALAAQEASNSGNDLKVRAVGMAASALFALLFLVFSGIAVMLGVLHGQFHWVLVAVPGAALLLSLIAVLATRRPAPGQRFSELRRQMAADIDLLRAAGVRHEQ
jgi:Kef-type K+ transport system membrane component KefB